MIRLGAVIYRPTTDIFTVESGIDGFGVGWELGGVDNEQIGENEG